MPSSRARKNPAMVTMPVAPFIHGAAQWAALIGLFGGGKVVVQPGTQHGPERSSGELVRDERVNLMTIVGDAMARPSGERRWKRAAAQTTTRRRVIVIGSAGAVFSEAVKERAQALCRT